MLSANSISIDLVHLFAYFFVVNSSSFLFISDERVFSFSKGRSSCSHMKNIVLKLAEIFTHADGNKHDTVHVRVFIPVVLCACKFVYAHMLILWCLLAYTLFFVCYSCLSRTGLSNRDIGCYGSGIIGYGIIG